MREAWRAACRLRKLRWARRRLGFDLFRGELLEGLDQKLATVELVERVDSDGLAPVQTLRIR